MADDETKLTRSRFFSKLQRSKSTKEEDTNRNVADFLKQPPSEKAALTRPKIDVAVAQRWPEAQIIRGPDALPSFQPPVNAIGARKKRRKLGLVVAFVASTPEIIGEGGDEAVYPTIEISRMRARSTSASEQRHDFIQQHRQQQDTKLPREASPEHANHMHVLGYPRNEEPAATDSDTKANHANNIPYDRKRSMMTANEGMTLRRASSVPHLDDHDATNEIHEHEHSGGPGTFSMQDRASQTQAHHQLEEVASLRLKQPSSLQTANHDDGRHLETQAMQTPSRSPRRTPSQQRYPGQAQYPDMNHQQQSRSAEKRQPSQAAELDTQLGSDVTPYVPYSSDASRSTTALLQDAIPVTSSTMPSDGSNDDSSPEQAGSQHRFAAEPTIPSQQSSAGKMALADFAARVAHMKGVFSLTADKERSDDRSSSSAWLRAANWWYLNGKMGLENEVKQRARSRQIHGRELLLQGHVDLAKAWWILMFPLEVYGSDAHTSTTQSQTRVDYVELLGHMQGLCLSLGRHDIMPPTASLIQGQDTRLWLPDTTRVESAHLKQSVLAMPATDALPLGDNNLRFCYSRLPVDVALSDRHGPIDQTTLSCLLTITRSRSDYHTAVVIASQDESLSLLIGTSNASLSWRDVSWSSSMSTITARLPDGVTLHARLQPNDYRSLGGLIEYTRKAVDTMQAAGHERLVFQAQLSSLQYLTSSSSPRFPRDVANCRLLVFKSHSLDHKLRLVFVTEPFVKILSCTSHKIDDLAVCLEQQSVQASSSLTLSFVNERDSPRAVLTFREPQDVLSFQSMARDRQHNGASSSSAHDQKENETWPSAKSRHSVELCRLALSGYMIQPASTSQATGCTISPLQWQEMVMTKTTQSTQSIEDSVTTEVVLHHAHGKFIDGLSHEKGELLLRLDTPSIQLYREPRPAFEAALDIQTCPAVIADAVKDMVESVQRSPTIHTYIFGSADAMHQFQSIITGFQVQYDGSAASFAISRRMMVVPIHHKWTATNVRLQIVSDARKSVVKILAFMAGFDHADAMCFQVKSTDVFEKIKGDSKGKKWSVKLVDAKFSLPARPGKNDDSEMKIRRQFVNLDGLTFAEEHDDITIGFDAEADRDLFARHLPAATTISRMLTLRRRI